MADMTESELLQALQDALEAAAENEDADGALTVTELSDQLDWYREKVCKWLRSLNRQGRLECIKVRRPAIDGSIRVSPAYRVVEAEDE